MLAVTEYAARIPGRGPHGTSGGQPVELRPEIIAILNQFIDRNNANAAEITENLDSVEGSISLVSNSVAQNELAIFLNPFSVTPPDLSGDVEALRALVNDLEVQSWL